MCGRDTHRAIGRQTQTDTVRQRQAQTDTDRQIWKGNQSIWKGNPLIWTGYPLTWEKKLINLNRKKASHPASQSHPEPEPARKKNWPRGSKVFQKLGN